MGIKIDKKITEYNVVKQGEDENLSATNHKSRRAEDNNNVVQMHEKLERPSMLHGSTYKISTPLSEHALYVTINDVILNPGTDHELRRPFEMFINSKNMDHYQWIVALTLIVSAVFRKGGDITFLVEELRSVFDPHGGYFKKGGKFMPSLVAEMGDVLENHLRMIGLLKDTGPDEYQKKFIAEKRAENDQRQSGSDDNQSDYPENAKLCKKCLTKASIMMDGCMTCLSCGDSKCS